MRTDPSFSKAAFPFEFWLKRTLFIYCLLITIGHAFAQTSSKATGYYQAQVIFPNETRIQVDVADTDEKRHLGLGERSSLAVGKGMLFIFEQRELHGFWMKKMRFPIDIIWLDNYRVVHIEHSVPAPPNPDSDELPIYKPSNLANFVLEIPAGQARIVGLQVGQRLRYVFPWGA